VETSTAASACAGAHAVSASASSSEHAVVAAAARRPFARAIGVRCCVRVLYVQQGGVGRVCRRDCRTSWHAPRATTTTTRGQSFLGKDGRQPASAAAYTFHCVPARLPQRVAAVTRTRQHGSFHGSSLRPLAGSSGGQQHHADARRSRRIGAPPRCTYTVAALRAVTASHDKRDARRAPPLRFQRLCLPALQQCMRRSVRCARMARVVRHSASSQRWRGAARSTNCTAHSMTARHHRARCERLMGTDLEGGRSRGVLSPPFLSHHAHGACLVRRSVWCTSALRVWLVACCSKRRRDPYLSEGVH
jgi:hypothetical protein